MGKFKRRQSRKKKSHNAACDKWFASIDAMVPRPNATIHPQIHLYDDVSCGFLDQDNIFRRIATLIIVQPEFDQLVFCIIVYNTVLLGFADYSNIYTNNENGQLGDLNPNGSLSNRVLLLSEWPLAFIYATEAFLKIIAMGFHGYIKEYWNQLDLVVSLAGILQVFIEMYEGAKNGGSLSFLRTFRVLRPLRSLGHFSGMRVVVDAMIEAIPRLVAVIVLVLFSFVLFGIMGVYLFNGLLGSRCRLTPFPVTLNWTLGADHDEYRCINEDTVKTITARPNWYKSDSPWNTARDCFWPVDEDDVRVCSNTAAGLHQCYHDTKWLNASEWRWCGSNYDAYGNPRFKGGAYISYYDSYVGQTRLLDKGVYEEDMNWGMTNFDDFPSAVITIFQILTLEGWTNIMYMSMDASGTGWAFFFCTIVFVGSFFVLNLVLAVLEHSFTTSRDKDLASILHHQLKETKAKPIVTPKTAKLLLNNFDNSDVLKKEEEEAAAAKAMYYSEHQQELNDETIEVKRRQSIKENILNKKRQSFKEIIDEYDIETDTFYRRKPTSNQLSGNQGIGNGNSFNSNNVLNSSKSTGNEITTINNQVTLQDIGNSGGDGLKRRSISEGHIQDEVDQENEKQPAGGNESQQTFFMRQAAAISPNSLLRRGAAIRGRRRRNQKLVSNRKSYFLITKDYILDSFFLFWRIIEKWWGRPPKSKWRVYVKETYLDSKWFEIVVLVIILFNTGTLMTDRWPMPHDERFILEVINFCLTSLFTLEMLLKIVGMGTYAYIIDPFNLMDGLIVVSSIIEYCFSPPEFVVLRRTNSETGAITALRCFRLFRIFKLSREWRSMHELLDKFVKTFWDVSNVAFIFLLLTYIFTLLGMQLFANLLKFDSEGYPVKIGSPAWENTLSPRANFDTILWSFVTIFQVLTAENWNDVLYSCRRAMGTGAVIFFFFLIVVGMFIILNLFLAILLSNFSAKEVARVKAVKAVEEAEEAIKEENLKQLLKLQEKELKEKTILTRANSEESLFAVEYQYKEEDIEKYVNNLKENIVEPDEAAIQARIDAILKKDKTKEEEIRRNNPKLVLSGLDSDESQINSDDDDYDDDDDDTNRGSTRVSSSKFTKKENGGAPSEVISDTDDDEVGGRRTDVRKSRKVYHVRKGNEPTSNPPAIIGEVAVNSQPSQRRIISNKTQYDMSDESEEEEDDDIDLPIRSSITPKANSSKTRPANQSAMRFPSFWSRSESTTGSCSQQRHSYQSSVGSSHGKRVKGGRRRRRQQKGVDGSNSRDRGSSSRVSRASGKIDSNESTDSKNGVHSRGSFSYLDNINRWRLNNYEVSGVRQGERQDFASVVLMAVARFRGYDLRESYQEKAGVHGNGDDGKRSSRRRHHRNQSNVYEHNYHENSEDDDHDDFISDSEDDEENGGHHHHHPHHQGEEPEENRNEFQRPAHYRANNSRFSFSSLPSIASISTSFSTTPKTSFSHHHTENDPGITPEVLYSSVSHIIHDRLSKEPETYDNDLYFYKEEDEEEDDELSSGSTVDSFLSSQNSFNDFSELKNDDDDNDDEKRRQKNMKKNMKKMKTNTSQKRIKKIRKPTIISRASSIESEDYDEASLLRTYADILAQIHEDSKKENEKKITKNNASIKSSDNFNTDVMKIKPVQHVFRSSSSTSIATGFNKGISDIMDELFFGIEDDEDSDEDEMLKFEKDENNDHNMESRELRLKARKLRDYDKIFPLEEERSFFLFGPDNKFRLFCAHIASTPNFERFTILMIFISSVALAFDNPFFSPKSPEYQMMHILDVFFSIYFFIEVLVKSTCNGLILGNNRAYLRDGFNVLDFVVMLSGLWGLIDEFLPTYISSEALSSIRSLRALRTLRPLRIIRRLQNLKLVVNSIVNVMPDVVNVLVLSLLFYTMFGIIFVQYLKGSFYGCGGIEMDTEFGANEKYENLLYHPLSWNDLSDELKLWFGACDDNNGLLYLNNFTITTNSIPCCTEWPTNLNKIPTSKEICTCKGSKWGPTVDQNFDNIFNAVTAQFELSTTEGWVRVMYACVDATGIDMQPIRNNAPGWALFMLVFMLIGNFFFINLFVGVLYERFTEMQKELKGRCNFLTKKQSDLIETQRLGLNFKPKRRAKPPKDLLGKLLFPMVQSPKFELTISICVSLNTGVMAMTYFGMSDTYVQVIDTINYSFAVIFFVECLVKLSALKFKIYFHDVWNRYDFVIAVGTAIALVIKFSVSSQGRGGVFIAALHTLRLGRILRLVRRAKSLREIFGTLYYTGLGLINVFGLLFLLLYIYTVMGVQLFAKVQYSGALDEHSNFRNFGLAMLTLFRCSTGEDWNHLMFDMAKQEPGCVASPEYDREMCGYNDRPGCTPLNGCGSDLSFVFLYSFTVLVTVVALNLFVGVILSGFEQAGDSGHLLAPEHFQAFQDIWMEYDEDATHYMDAIRLMHMLQNIEEPWGFGKEYQANERELITRIERLNLPVYNPPPGTSNRVQVYYYDVFLALTEFAAMRAIQKNTDKFGSYFGVNTASTAMSKITAAAARAIDEASKHPHSTVLMKNIIEMSHEAAADVKVNSNEDAVKEFEANLEAYNLNVVSASVDINVKDKTAFEAIADRSKMNFSHHGSGYKHNSSNSMTELRSTKSAVMNDSSNHTKSMSELHNVKSKSSSLSTPRHHHHHHHHHDHPNNSLSTPSSRKHNKHQNRQHRATSFPLHFDQALPTDNNDNDDDDNDGEEAVTSSGVHFLSPQHIQSNSLTSENSQGSSIKIRKNNKKVKDRSPVIKPQTHKLSINNGNDIELHSRAIQFLNKSSEEEEIKMDDKDDLDLEMGGSSDYDSSMEHGSSLMLDETDSSSFYSESTEEEEKQWEAFEDLASEEHTELRRIKRMVAKLRTRVPLMDYWGQTVYTVKHDFMVRLIQRCFLRKIRGRAFASFFDPDGAAGLNVDKLEYDEDVSNKPMLLTSHIVKGTNIRYMVKMGGGVPHIYFRQLKEMHRANPHLNTFTPPPIPQIKKTGLFIDLGDVADALILADGSVQSTVAVLERRGSTDISDKVLSKRTVRSSSGEGSGFFVGGAGGGSTSSVALGGKGGGSGLASPRMRNNRFHHVKRTPDVKTDDKPTVEYL